MAIQDNTDPSPTRTVVHCVRHGEVENPEHILYGRLPGFHLSHNGRLMSALVAEWFEGKNVTQLWTSPLERARETAAYVAPLFELDPQVDERLIEVGNFLQGFRRDGLMGLVRRPDVLWKLRNPFTPSWGEEYASIAARMKDVVHEVRKAAVGTEAICVSHQTAIEVLRRAMGGQPLWHLPNMRMCTLASITSFTFDGEALVDISYAEPAIELVPPRLRARTRRI